MLFCAMKGIQRHDAPSVTTITNFADDPQIGNSGMSGLTTFRCLRCAYTTLVYAYFTFECGPTTSELAIIEPDADQLAQRQ